MAQSATTVHTRNFSASKQASKPETTRPSFNSACVDSIAQRAPSWPRHMPHRSGRPPVLTSLGAAKESVNLPPVARIGLTEILRCPAARGPFSLLFPGKLRQNVLPRLCCVETRPGQPTCTLPCMYTLWLSEAVHAACCHTCAAPYREARLLSPRAAAFLASRRRWRPRRRRRSSWQTAGQPRLKRGTRRSVSGRACGRLDDTGCCRGAARHAPRPLACPARLPCALLERRRVRPTHRAVSDTPSPHSTHGGPPGRQRR